MIKKNQKNQKIDNQYVDYLALIEDKSNRQHKTLIIISIIVTLLLITFIGYCCYNDYILMMVVVSIILVVVWCVCSFRNKWIEDQKEKQLKLLFIDYEQALDLSKMIENSQGHTTFESIWHYRFDI